MWVEEQVVGERGVVGNTEEGHEPGDGDDGDSDGDDGDDGDNQHERLAINTSIDRDPVLYGQHPDKIPPGCMSVNT